MVLLCSVFGLQQRLMDTSCSFVYGQLSCRSDCSYRGREDPFACKHRGTSLIILRRRKMPTADFRQLGGKSPAVIDPDCDLKSASRRLMWAKMSNAGQVRAFSFLYFCQLLDMFIFYFLFKTDLCLPRLRNRSQSIYGRFH